MSETEDPGLRERPREGRIHESVPTPARRATNSSQSSLAVGEKLKQLQPSREQSRLWKLCKTLRQKRSEFSTVTTATAATDEIQKEKQK